MLQAIRDEHPIIPKIERFRELSKLVQTYLDALPNWIGDDGRLHTTFLQVTAATGRLASINPNLQNIPIRTETGREIRACFVAEPGNVLISVDYSQVELGSSPTSPTSRCCATSSCAARTSHTETAGPIFDTAPENLTVGMRSKAKMVNYGIVYGLSAYGLADRLQIEQEEAQEFIDRYLARFPAVAQFMADAVTQAEEHGYVSTLFGRRRQIPEIRARNWQTRKLGERLAVNRCIQGTAADIIKVAMVRSHDALRDAGLQTRCVLQIHDELLFEGPDRRGRPATRDRPREMAAPSRSTRRSPSSRASARTGWTRSSGPRGGRRAHRRRRRPRRPAGADQLPLGKNDRDFQAAFFSFATGTIILAVIAALARGGLGQIGGGAHARAAVPDRRRAGRVSTSRPSS